MIVYTSHWPTWLWITTQKQHQHAKINFIAHPASVRQSAMVCVPATPRTTWNLASPGKKSLTFRKPKKAKMNCLEIYIYIYIYTYTIIYIYEYTWSSKSNKKIIQKSNNNIHPAICLVMFQQPPFLPGPSSLGSPKNGLVFEVVPRNYRSRSASITPPTASVRPPRENENKSGRLSWLKRKLRLRSTWAMCCSTIFGGHVLPNPRELQLHWFKFHLCLPPHRWHRPHRPTWHISANPETAPRPLQGLSLHRRPPGPVASSRFPSAAGFAPGRWRIWPSDQCYSASDDRNEKRGPAKKERLETLLCQSGRATIRVQLAVMWN